MTAIRLILIIIGLGTVWQIIVWASQVPHYILPSPIRVIESWINNYLLILDHASTTLIEIGLGLIIGTIFGTSSALIITWSNSLRRWLLPLLVASQAIPVFAIAPLLVLWLGYGMTSKVAMAALIIYFPVVASLYDGLRRTEIGWLDLAKTMGASKWSILFHIRIPAALPSMASGLRVAAAVAPIGAIVGEWVGASAGLGYLMLHANGQMQIDLMFAALLTLTVFAVIIYFIVDYLLRILIPWQTETSLEYYEERK